jgi:hypothetical protein
MKRSTRRHPVAGFVEERVVSEVSLEGIRPAASFWTWPSLLSQVEQMLRLRGRRKHRVDYRHIIDW